jgi:hypothetical protein
LRLSGTRGEHVTFQIAVRSSATALKGVEVKLTSSSLGPLVVQREKYTLITTAASNVTMRGVGRYPDPPPFPNDTVHFSQGGDVVDANVTAA